jgi:hypothetical protein
MSRRGFTICRGVVTMTREELRQALLDGADKLRHSAVWRFLSQREQTLSVCTRQFWSTDEPVVNDALDALLTLIEVHREIALLPGTLCWELWGVPPGTEAAFLERFPNEVIPQASTAQAKYEAAGYTHLEMRRGVWPNT